MLEKAGVEPPKNWDEMKAAAKAIKAKVGGTSTRSASPA